MHTLNLGDSAYMLLRPQVENGDMKLNKIYRSEEQQHSFNRPFQCGMRYDPPINAFDYSHVVEHNDIVIMGTDGVYDNLFDKQIIDECIKPHMTVDGSLSSPDEVATAITELAEQVSYSETEETPWTQHAVAHGKKLEDEIGGKTDDITVIVAQIKLWL